jgi:hypothetical protein
MKTIYYLYRITNTINGKIYVGIHRTNNLNDGYMGSGTVLKRAQTKHGINNFKKEILDTFENPEDMYIAETKLVNEEFVSRNDTYNIKKGGHGGFDYINDNYSKADRVRINTAHSKIFTQKLKEDPVFAEDFKEKCSIGQKRRWKEGVFDNRTHCSFEGKHHTEETKIKIGIANAAHQRGERNSMYGKQWIYNIELKESKRIDKNEPIPQGWLKGRKMKF